MFGTFSFCLRSENVFKRLLKFCILTKPDTRSDHCLKSYKRALTRRINYSRLHVTSNTIITRAYQSSSGSPDYQIFSHG